MRFAATMVLWLATTAALAVAVPTAWVQVNLIDADGYAALARKAAGDPTLQSAMATVLTSRVTTLIAHGGRPDDSSLVHDVASAYTAGPSFPPRFAQASKVAHEWLFGGAVAPTNTDSWVLDLTPMIDDNPFRQLLSDFDVQAPATMTVPLTVDRSKTLQPGRLRPLTSWGPRVSIGAAALSATAALLTLAAARRRWRALSGLGVSALLAGAVDWAVVTVAHRRVTNALDHSGGDIGQIAEVLANHAETGMHQWLDLTLAVGGVLTVLGVSVAALSRLWQSGTNR
ncbi:MAG: hypothetical protein QJR12_00970 [Mycobacterium sp.]|uniref:hypothetical protein n=1 Tax=Mycobacterium sp. TaxID=1785 RepID=UPI002624DED8|nr:hypothetical protein [Mycobacterium sp.]MDI3312895.1 hypothetical protein [Mycobacterium sp.]